MSRTGGIVSRLLSRTGLSTWLGGYACLRRVQNSQKRYAETIDDRKLMQRHRANTGIDSRLYSEKFHGEH